jgi:hypothetical protein|tara:strand:- start:4366 stop:4551 length:186 start_codon:yes stop_codon:yes gene_type:complete
MNGYIDPTKEAFMAFRDNAQKGPIHMLNLVRFSEIATYSDGRNVTGSGAYAAYRKMQLSLS